MPGVILEPVGPVPQRKRAPMVVGPTNTTPLRPTHQLPQNLIDDARTIPKVQFDSKRHVGFKMPKRTYTMAEWGLEDQGVSPIAASDPFPLFTPEAVQQARREIFSEGVLKDCQFASTFTKNMVRGYSKEVAPFIHSLWTCPEVQQAVSKVAGIDLVHAFDYEIGHVNILVNNGGEEEKARDNVGFSWHYDSFPFVCVSMLSDCSQMTGGETAVRTGSGEVMKVRGPTMGTAVILQGRYIKHAALKAFGGKERITMITPFRPKHFSVKDELLLTGSRNISDQSKLLYGYTTYRATLLEERMRDHAQKLREQEQSGQKFNVDAVREFILEQKELLEATLAELVPLRDVV